MLKYYIVRLSSGNCYSGGPYQNGIHPILQSF